MVMAVLSGTRSCQTHEATASGLSSSAVDHHNWELEGDAYTLHAAFSCCSECWGGSPWACDAMVSRPVRKPRRK